MAGVLALRAVGAARRARFATPALAPREVAQRRALTALLHVLQPLVRLHGRLLHGLTPWRRLPARERKWPRIVRVERWSEHWVDPIEWVRRLESGVLAAGAVVRRGGDFDSWDIETRGGVLAGARASTVIEEHGAGRQLARFRCRPWVSRVAVATALVLLILGALAAIDGAVAAAIVLWVLGAALALRIGQETAVALGLTVRVARELEL
jgi:hypothetical protein